MGSTRIRLRSKRSFLPALAIAGASLTLSSLALWSESNAAAATASEVSAAAAQAVEAEPSSKEHSRFHTNRKSRIDLPLPEEKEAFTFAVFGDRTGGPPEGVRILEAAVGEVNLFEPDLVMTVGDLIQGYSENGPWLKQAAEYRGIMDELLCPWFPVAGNHDVYWRGQNRPEGEHDANYEQHFGPLWYAFRHKSAWFVVLYSDEGNPATGEKTFSDPEAQRMSPEQFAWLDGTLKRAADSEHVFVFLHHPRWIGGNYGDDWDRVHARLVEAGNVSAVFAGHIHHMRYDGPRDGIEYFTLATVGGGQSGEPARAGYLHQYLHVTVRDDRLSVASLPVGSAEDPRRITAQVGLECRLLAREFSPEWSQDFPLASNQATRGSLRFSLKNPTSRPIEITVATIPNDLRWQLTPEHQHLRIEAGASSNVRLEFLREEGPLDAAFLLPEIELRTDYLTEDWRFEIAPRRFELPITPARLKPHGAGSEEFALLLDGEEQCLAVDSNKLPLPDGPFTLEAWVNADEYRPRQGLMTKTESSEYGIFVNDGRPAFYAHLNSDYAKAEADKPLLKPKTWHHIAGQFDGIKVSLFVDGKLIDSKPARGSRTPNDLPLLIGADVDGRGQASSNFPGLIDEVRLSIGARYTDNFIPERRHEVDSTTMLLLHMDGAMGPWLFDSSPGTRHPRMLGRPSVTKVR